MTSENRLFRTLRYSLVNVEKMFAKILIMALAYETFGYLGSGGKKNEPSVLVIYFAIISVIMVFILQMLNDKQYIPTLISFGSRRIDVLMGIQLMNFIYIIQCILIFSACILLFPGPLVGKEPEIIIIYFISLFSFCGFGSMVVSAYKKFGKIGGFIAVSIILVLVVIILTISVLVIMNVQDFGSIFTFSLNQYLVVILVSFIIYFLGIYFSHRVLMKYEVRG